MLELYWGCFIAGIVLALGSILFGEVLDGFLEGTGISSLTLFGGLTAFGGIGVILSKYVSWNWAPLTVLAVTLLITILIMIAVHFLYVSPMKKAENSTSYSIRELVGKSGEVSIAIPANGYGEVVIRVGAGRTNHIAASFDGTDIASGEEVYVVEVKEGTLYVSRLNLDVESFDLVNK